MTEAWQDEIDRAAERRVEQIVATRRHMHAHPELSGQEHETTLYLYQLLGDLDARLQMGPEGRGVVADLFADTTGQRGLFALRADIDALPLHDQKPVAYRSQNEGVMHACGHDGHSAALYGALLTLSDVQRAGKLPWPIAVRAVFQPAEETVAGSQEMIEIGALEGVEAILALHVDPTRPVGVVGLREGVLTASCDDMRITILGRGGHAARPHESIDPVVAAAQLVNALYLYIPRATDSRDAVVVTIGQMFGGQNPNVIPESVELRGTVRTLEPHVREKTIRHIRHLAGGIAATSTTQIDVQFNQGVHSIINNPAVIELVRRSGREVLGNSGVVDIPRPSMGAEDFARYLNRVPGAMFRLGCARPGAQVPGLHTPTFDIDERALTIGAKLLARSTVLWFDPARRNESRDARHAFH